MAKRGPKTGVSKWRWYVIKRERDGKYFVGKRMNSYRFGKLEDAPSWRLKEAYSLLCRIRRFYRQRERYYFRGRRRAKPKPPETFVLEVKGDPKAEVRYPWPMPM